MAIVNLKTGKPMTRRECVKGGLAAILAAGVAPSLCGSITSGMQYRNLAGRLAAFSNTNQEEEMYKEMYLKLCRGFSTAGESDIVIDMQGLQVTGYAFYGNKSTSLVIQRCPSLITNSFNGMASLISVEFDEYMTEFANNVFRGCSSLLTVNAPNLTTLNATAFFQVANIKDIYIANKTKAQLVGSYPFGVTNNQCVFHLKDGDYDIEGHIIQ